MSFVRSVSSKNSGNTTVKSSLPNLPRLPSRISSKPSTRTSITLKTELKLQLSTVPNQEDLEDIVNNLSTIVKRSEEVLTPHKSSHITTNVRRTTSLHMTSRQNLSNSLVKTSNSHHETLTESNLDISRLNTSRHSLRNAEKFSGIKCSLPSRNSTIPNTFKGLEKHKTPTKTKQTNTCSSIVDNQRTPITTNGKTKSPWRIRFEKILNNQELTPLSPANESVAFTTVKTSSLVKGNRTPSFRLPTRRISKIHILSRSEEE